jgi:hypothetical protein
MDETSIRNRTMGPVTSAWQGAPGVSALGGRVRKEF